MKRQKAEHRLDVGYLAPDGEVIKAKGFMSLYNNGIIYINKDLASQISDDVNWVKVGIDSDKKVLMLKPSKTPINSYKVERVGNTIMVRHVPTTKLRLAVKNRLNVYLTEQGLLVSLV